MVNFRPGLCPTCEKSDELCIHCTKGNRVHEINRERRSGTCKDYVERPGTLHFSIESKQITEKKRTLTKEVSTKKTLTKKEKRAAKLKKIAKRKAFLKSQKG